MLAISLQYFPNFKKKHYRHSLMSNTEYYVIQEYYFVAAKRSNKSEPRERTCPKNQPLPQIRYPTPIRSTIPSLGQAPCLAKFIIFVPSRLLTFCTPYKIDLVQLGNSFLCQTRHAFLKRCTLIYHRSSFHLIALCPAPFPQFEIRVFRWACPPVVSSRIVAQPFVHATPGITLQVHTKANVPELFQPLGCHEALDNPHIWPLGFRGRYNCGIIGTIQKVLLEALVVVALSLGPIR